MLPLQLTKRALRQIARAQSWWLDQRDKAPEAMEDDLRDAYAFLSSRPHAAPVWKRASRGVAIRRYYMERVRYHLYFRIEIDALVILALWHAARRPPQL